MDIPRRHSRLAVRGAALLALSFVVTSCSAQNARVGVLAQDAPRDALPTAMITWCGDHAPAHLGLTGDVYEMLYTPESEPEGNLLEVDLADPGPGWTVEVELRNGETWTVEDGRGYIPDPMTHYQYRLGVSTDQAEDAAEADLGSTTFTINRLSREEGVYESLPDDDPGYEVTPIEGFALEC
ncbi:hypothetical protein F4561_000093 [Lipingzhangella halophila]|uniref:Uncharacterized protein n=1 Tax=Lipingzhangella halophila TaxID=1783352 RepID=A0A7W7RCV7_9ACTN|nr:hypothetical protein [Lipingzhangella halophila]MBB4929273.1 hypothetical protein [Lipingzhangella halophila]